MTKTRKTLTTFSRETLLLSTVLLTPSTVALAQSDADVLGAVRACQNVSSRNERLACYDSALAPANTLAAKEPVSPADIAPVEVETLNQSAQPEAIEASQAAITATIVDVRTLRSGQARFLTADGQVFEQWRSRAVLRLPDPPFEVELESGALGATFFRLGENGLRIRVTLRD